MTLDWIIDTLKQSGCNSKRQVINALENASADELLELGVSCIKQVFKPLIDEIVRVIDEIVRVLNSEDFKEKLKEYMEMLHSGTNGESN